VSLSGVTNSDGVSAYWEMKVLIQIFDKDCRFGDDADNGDIFGNNYGPPFNL